MRRKASATRVERVLAMSGGGGMLQNAARSASLRYLSSFAFALSFYPQNCFLRCCEISPTRTRCGSRHIPARTIIFCYSFNLHFLPISRTAASKVLVRNTGFLLNERHRRYVLPMSQHRNLPFCSDAPGQPLSRRRTGRSLRKRNIL